MKPKEWVLPVIHRWLEGVSVRPTIVPGTMWRIEGSGDDRAYEAISPDGDDSWWLRDPGTRRATSCPWWAMIPLQQYRHRESGHMVWAANQDEAQAKLCLLINGKS